MNRTLPAVALSLLVLAVSGCSKAGEQAAPSTAPSVDTSVTTQPPATTTSATTPSATGTSAPSGTPSIPTFKTTAPSVTGSCLKPAVRNLPGVVTNVAGPAKQTAAQLTTAVHGCDSASLIALARRSGTLFGFDTKANPAKVLALPQDSARRYDLLAVLLSVAPAKEDAAGHVSYVWPAVASTDKQNDDAAWTAAIRAGLVTKDQAAQMRQEQTGYLGYRIRISASGTWESFVSGD